jgi:hypothetical protein
MKSKWILMIALACASAIPALAQGSDKVEITGDYSYFRFNPSLPAIQHRNLDGGGFDLSFFLRPVIAFKADVQFYGGTNFTTTFGAVNTSAGFIPAGTYSTNGTLKTYLFGPMIKGRLHHFEPFGEVLFGVSHVDAYENLSRLIALTPTATLHVQGSENPFTMAAGGGIDLPVGKVFAIRLAEFDYVLTRLSNPLTSTNNQNHFRYQAGVQFRFGGK